ncbi:hypothetical protein DRO02_00955 [archaeon]|nr:MAG: hypothetical protein DRO02_00955 [archaeon]RLG66182.1 MAG: hypothetical protein DRO21_00020 [archaeon]HDM24140.1 hypothetical protein [Candidatus Bathyarchaeota archaeon]
MPMTERKYIASLLLLAILVISATPVTAFASAISVPVKEYTKKPPKIAILDPMLKEILAKAKPFDYIETIVMFNEYPTSELLNKLETEYGVIINHVYKIIPGIYCKVPAGKITEIAKLSETYSISYNREVKLLYEGKPMQIITENVPEEVWELWEIERDLHIFEVWDEGYTGKGVRIGVIDTGANARHPDIADKLVGWHDLVAGSPTPYDIPGHGTHICSILAGTGAAAKLMNWEHEEKGLAPDAGIVMVCASTTRGIPFSNIVRGLEILVYEDPVDVISLSFGGLWFEGNPLDEAIKNAYMHGIVIVVAAGNDGPAGSQDYPQAPFYRVGSPACYPWVITAGGCKEGFPYNEGNPPRMWAMSSPGPGYMVNTPYDLWMKPDVIAPAACVLGADTNFTAPGHSYYQAWPGTSFATPCVAAVCALLVQYMKENYGYVDPEAIRTALLEGARTIGMDPTYEGAGVVDAYAALQKLKETPYRLKMFPDRMLEFVLPGGPYWEKACDEIATIPRDKIYRAPIYSSYLEVHDVTVTLEGNASEIIEFSYPNGQSYTKYITQNGERVLNPDMICVEVHVKITTATKIGVYTGTLSLYANGTLIYSKEIAPIVVSNTYLLWDLYHDTDKDYSPAAADSIFGNYIYVYVILNRLGYWVEQSIYPLQYAKLKRMDILVVPEPEKEFDESEKQAIFRFIKEGGTYIPMYDTKEYVSIFKTFACFCEYVNETTAPYGIYWKSMELNNIVELTSDPITSPWIWNLTGRPEYLEKYPNGLFGNRCIKITNIDATHPILAGISAIYFGSNSSLLFTEENKPGLHILAWMTPSELKDRVPRREGHATVALAIYNGTEAGEGIKGNVIAFGDDDVFLSSLGVTVNNDSWKLIFNLFTYLRKPLQLPTVITPNPELGQVKIARGERLTVSVSVSLADGTPYEGTVLLILKSGAYVAYESTMNMTSPGQYTLSIVIPRTIKAGTYNVTVIAGATSLNIGVLTIPNQEPSLYVEVPESTMAGKTETIVIKATDDGLVSLKVEVFSPDGRRVKSRSKPLTMEEVSIEFDIRFDKAGTWKIKIHVEDNDGATLDRTVNIDVSGFTAVHMIGIVFVGIIVIVAIIFFLKKRKKKPEEAAEAAAPEKAEKPEESGKAETASET